MSEQNTITIFSLIVFVTLLGITTFYSSSVITANQENELKKLSGRVAQLEQQINALSQKK